MKITLSENLRKMRRDRNLTQEDLASFLGISFQAVSKWERDEGYPDISMLPIIANFFNITVDTLIGNDVIAKEDRIKQFCNEYERFNMLGDMESAVAVAKEAYHEYPYDWSIIDIYVLSLTAGYTVHPGESLSELRDLCHMIKDKCTDAKIKMHAVYSMLFAENDDMVEDWFNEVPGTYDYCEWERREARYFERNQMDEYRNQKQENMMQLFNYLFEKIGENLSDIGEMIEAFKLRSNMIQTLFVGDNFICFKFRYAFNLLKLSSLYFEYGDKENAYTTLEESVSAFIEWFSIPENTDLHYVGLFDTLTAKRTQTPNTVLRFLTGNRQLSGFKDVVKEERFIKLSKALSDL